MRTIWKYDIGVTDEDASLLMPHGGRTCLVACQHPESPDSVQLWVEFPQRDAQRFDPNNQTVSIERFFRVFGTGHPVPGGYALVGSAICLNGRLVWHLYERTN